MSDWIKREAEKIKTQEQSKIKQGEQGIQRLKQIEAHRDGFWREVVKAVEAEVKDFNGQFPDNSAKRLYIDSPTGPEVKVRREVSA